MASQHQKKIWRQQNRKRKEYFKQYYTGERAEINRQTSKRSMRKRIESGDTTKKVKQKKRLEEIRLRNKKYIIEIDGHVLYEKHYAVDKKVKRLAPATFWPYVSRGIIPRLIYEKTFHLPWGKQPKIRKRQYLSERQIKLLNYVFSKGTIYKTLEEKSAYLFANWTKDELGFGSEGDDTDDD